MSSVCTWRALASVPPDLGVRQVYGILLSSQGQVLMLRDGDHLNLPGGKPEPGESWLETLDRECLEEAQVTIADPLYLGYVEVNESNATYAQVRYLARISKLLPSAPDCATGRLYERIFVKIEDAATMLQWGEHGVAQFATAMGAAAQRSR
jgi:8-oxo-dGTP diphosphatase